MSREINNNGIINNGDVNYSTMFSGIKPNVVINGDFNPSLSKSGDSNGELMDIKKLLCYIESNMSEHKHSLDELSKQFAIIQNELNQENPSEEKITKYKKDLLSTVHQATGAIVNFHNILKMLQPYLM